MARIGRVVAINAGLIGAGAVFGAFAGSIAVTTCLILTGSFLDSQFLFEGFMAGGFFGAPLGAITAPLLGWLMLRPVPLGRAFMGSTYGTMIGAVAGWFAPTHGDVLLNALVSALIGCVTATIVLRGRAQRA